MNRGRPGKKTAADEKEVIGEVVNPLDFFDFDPEADEVKAEEHPQPEETQQTAGKGLFFMGTGFASGKTSAIKVLGALLQKHGTTIGVMKPVTCGGDKTEDVLKTLDISEARDLACPYFLPEKLPPHSALKRRRKRFSINKIKGAYSELAKKYDLVCVEGSGGPLTPLGSKYTTLDLARELAAGIILVSQNDDNAINFVMMAVSQLSQAGLVPKGIILTAENDAETSGGFMSNAHYLRQAADVPVLGVIPHLKTMDQAEILEQCRGKLRIKALLQEDQQKDQQKDQPEEKADPQKQKSRPRRPRRSSRSRRKPSSKKEPSSQAVPQSRQTE